MPPPAVRARSRKTRAPKVTAVRAPRARLEVDERRAQLVRLGIDLFAARAYDEVSIDELARAAGVSKGLLYHYFPTKRDFYVATVSEASRELPDVTPTPLIRTAVRGWLGFCEATSLDWIERRTVTRSEIRDLMLEVLLATIPIAARGSG